jgi:predicted 3-demethylubiquinone-9 3-methyltransferase (glyoxalase superfamily)
MPSTTPCLWFDGQAEEAAALYTSLFPNSAVTSVSPGPDGAALMVTFTLDGRDYQGLNGGPQFPFTEAVSLSIACADQAEVDHYWDGLIAGGGRESRCGWLKDRFGLSWQVVPDRLQELLTDPASSGRVMAALMPMNRIVVADLEAAAGARP